MENDKDAIKETVTNNKIQQNSMVRVPMIKGKWQATMACGSMIWDVK